MTIYAKIENSILACRDDSLDGFDKQRAVAEGFTAHNVPDVGWLQIQGGSIVEVDPTAQRLKDAQDAACAEIDTRAGVSRQSWVSDGWGISLEYERRKTAATDYLAAVAANANDPTGIPVPASVQSSADYINGTPVDGANDILSQADQMYAVLDQIGTARLAGKAAVKAAEDEAGVEAALRASIAELDSLVAL